MSLQNKYLMLLQVAHYLVLTLVNLDEEGTPMADLTNLQQPLRQLPPAELPPMVAKSLTGRAPGQVARMNRR